jgi:WD40 repeat protein
MTDSQQPEDYDSYNERSLKRLTRAIQLSAGRFSLNLVRCNYTELQQDIQRRLRDCCTLKIQSLQLQASDQQLYTAIKSRLGDQQPQALMVSGFESVVSLNDLLIASNQVRDDFHKSFAFPIVLWVSDEVLKKLMRLAPDFNSWSAIPIHFAISTQALEQLLQRETDTEFTEALDLGAGRFPRSFALYLGTKTRSHKELKLALKELRDRGREPAPELKASLDFVLGQDAYANEPMAAARTYYEQSLEFWQRSTAEPNPSSRFTERLGCVLFYLGLWWRRKAVLERAQFEQASEKARDYYQQCIDTFQQGQRSDLAAKFINALGEVLQRQLQQKGLPIPVRRELANRLGSVAKTAVELHRTYFDPIRLAYSYGLLAEVALAKQSFHKALRLADLALQTNELSPSLASETQPRYAERSWARRHYRSLYRLLQAQAQAMVISVAQALLTLEIAREECNHAYDPFLYTRILEALHDLYFKQGRYLDAFNTKENQRSIEQQYSLRAFIGAVRLQPARQVLNPALVPIESPDASGSVEQSSELFSQQATVAQEITASGREQDVENLIQRVSEDRYQPIIVHGPSGVGKSSIISAGLVPALKQNPIGDRRVLPVLVRVYRVDLARELGKCFAEALREIGIRDPVDNLTQATDFQPLVNQLKENDHRSLRTVMIFDQFEEFFFAYPKPKDRKPFYEFLRACLSLPFVKVVLSLREDFIHYLLELSQLELDDITNDILKQEKRYPLGNFDPKDAKLIIDRLTQRSQFHLEPDLINQLVKDLAAELGKVRPIELQIVGAQLQDSDITTLQAYQSLGPFPKEKLVEQFLEQVIKDCGQENEQVAHSVLSLLTDEKGTRPLKTPHELTANLKGLELPVDEAQLGLVLSILVKSGLVLDIPEIPIERYQLVHDYLAALVQRKCKPVVDGLIDTVKRNKLIQDSLQRNRRVLLGLAVGLGVPVIGLACLVLNLMVRAAIAETEATVTRSSSQLRANEQLEALTSSIETGIQLNQRGLLSFLVPDATRALTLGNLLETTYSIQEHDRFIGHRLYVNSVSFSPKAQLLASASADNTIILWSLDGNRLHQLEGHTSRVNSVSFSPDGKRLVSASDDTTIKLWDTDGHLLRTFPGHKFSVTSVAFSPDNRTLVSASDDSTVKLWDSHSGKQLKTLTNHQDRVKAVSFSPDRQLFASASWDGTVRLWNQQGLELKQFGKIGDSRATSVSFSPDGATLASGGWDNTIKLWSMAGNPAQVLTGHTDWVKSVAFSPDGRTIASASNDGTVRLWNRERGSEIRVLKIPNVNSVSFGSDNQTLITTGADSIIRFWSLNGISPTILKDETPISSFSFSPDGQWLASGSRRSVYAEVVPSTSNEFRSISRQVNGKIQLRHLDGNGIVFPTTGSFDRVKFSPNGRMLASLETFPSNSGDQVSSQIKLWNLSGEQLKTLSLEGEATDLSFSPDGRAIAIAENKGTQKIIGSIKIWSFERGDLKIINAHNDKITSISFSQDGTLVSGSNDSTVKLWSQTGKLLKRLSGHTRLVNSVSFSPNGKVIASAGADATVKLWNPDGQELRTLTGHTSGVTSVSFSQNGKLLVSGGDEGTIKVWNVEDGELLATLRRNENQINGVGFSPDGKAIVSISNNAASNDNTISVWQFNLDALLQSGCAWLTHYLETNGDIKDNNLCQQYPSTPTSAAPQ